MLSLAEKERFSSRFAASHLANIVVSLAYAWRAPDTPYLLTRSTALHPPPAALVSLPLAGARVQIFSDPSTQKAHLSVCFALAEKERFEFVCRRPIRLICLRKRIKWAKSGNFS